MHYTVNDMIWIIAWKNVWRNRLRSLVVVMAIAFGLLGGVFSSAVMKGTSDQRIREAVSREISHIQVHHPGYVTDNEIRYTLGSDASKLGAVLDTMRQVAAWTPRIRFTAMAGSANAGTGVMVNGIDPDKEKSVTEIHSLICDSCGSWFPPTRGVPVVIGEALAKKLKIKRNSKLILTFQDMDGNLTGAALRVCGIYRTSNSVFDEMNIFVKNSDLMPLLSLPENTFHEIAILCHDPGAVDATEQALKGLFPGLLVQNWKEIDPLIGMMNDFLDLWLYLFMGIIMLALGFGIVNTMLMAILERTRELGMLAAIGMNKRRVFALVMLESVFLSLTGGLLGILMGTMLTWYTAHTGIDLGSFAEGFEKLGYSTMLYPSLDFIYFFNLTVIVILTGILASVYPARQALLLRPADAIRAE